MNCCWNCWVVVVVIVVFVCLFRVWQVEVVCCCCRSCSICRQFTWRQSGEESQKRRISPRTTSLVLFLSFFYEFFNFEFCLFFSHQGFVGKFVLSLLNSSQAFFPSNIKCIFVYCKLQFVFISNCNVFCILFCYSDFLFVI